MKKLKKIASISISISLTLLLCVPIVNSHAEDIEVTESLEQEEIEVPIVPEVLKFTLEEAIQKGLESSPQIEQSKFKVEKAEVDYRENKYDIRQNKKMLYNEKETSLNYLKAVKVPEFSNEFFLENSKIEHKIVEENLEREIEEMYFNLVQAENIVDINKSSVELNKKLYDISEIKKELGMVVNQEVLNSKLNHRKSVETYEQSIKNLEKLRMVFNTKIGLNTLQEVELLDELKQKEFDEEDKRKNVEDYIEEALENRNEIKLLEFSYELEELKMDVTEREHSDITFVYKQQVVELEKAEEALKNAKDNIELEVRSNYKQMKQKEDELDSAKQSIELVKEGLRAAQISYEVGTGVLLDVNTAQNNLDQAELGLSNAIFNYNLEVLKFEAAIGIKNL